MGVAAKYHVPVPAVIIEFSQILLSRKRLETTCEDFVLLLISLILIWLLSVPLQRQISISKPTNLQDPIDFQHHMQAAKP